MEPATEIPKADELFDLRQTEHAELFQSLGQAWEVVPRIAGYLEANLRTQQLGQALGQAEIRGNIFIGEGALIQGPVWIGRNCRIGHGATLRENLIVGDDCFVGHSVEVKNSILFNGCEVPHFNYVGDSVLGYRVHLGAGAKLSNYRLFRGNVNVRLANQKVDTGSAKLGALIGDRTELGCNAVLHQGTILGRDCLLYPNVTFGGVLLVQRLVKNKNKLAVVARRDGDDD